MEDRIAFCGLICNECGAWLATKNDDDEKRAEVAKLWSQILTTELKSGDINCEGCRSEKGLLFSYCKVCEVRKCGMERGVVNCAYCDEYPCKKLDFIFGSAPESKKRLDEIKRGSQA